MPQQTIEVVVAYATPTQQVEIPVQMAPGLSVAVAIKCSAIIDRFPALQWPPERVGINSRLCSLDAIVQAGDRVEIYRPLKLDPKQARRLRVKRRANP